jgi:hypothetical protein
MKNLLTIMALGIALMVFSTNADAQFNTLSRYAKVTDTVTNTGSKNMTSPRVAGPRQNVTVTTMNTNLTGTLGGVARLWGSLDGTTYFRIRSTQLQGAQVDSLVIDATHTKYAWVVEKSPFQYYQIQTTGVGTTTFTVQGKIVAH